MSHLAEPHDITQDGSLINWPHDITPPWYGHSLGRIQCIFGAIRFYIIVPDPLNWFSFPFEMAPIIECHAWVRDFLLWKDHIINHTDMSEKNHDPTKVCGSCFFFCIRAPAPGHPGAGYTYKHTSRIPAIKHWKPTFMYDLFAPGQDFGVPTRNVTVRVHTLWAWGGAAFELGRLMPPFRSNKGGINYAV